MPSEASGASDAWASRFAHEVFGRAIRRVGVLKELVRRAAPSLKRVSPILGSSTVLHIRATEKISRAATERD
jgi:hypothetical protein